MEDQLIIPNERDRIMELIKTTHLGIIEISRQTGSPIQLVLEVFKSYLNSFIL